MSRRKQNIAETPGHDAFLDIVANLVGILIILVVVTGAHAVSTWSKKTQADPEHLANVKKLKSELDTLATESAKYERDQFLLREKLQSEKALIVAKQVQRHQMLVQIKLAEQKMQQSKESLSQVQQANFEQQAEVEQLSAELRQVNFRVESLANRKAPIEKIDHFPTPVAKTVFNEEFHFQLKNGRLSRVPIEELVERVKAEVRLKAEKLQSNAFGSTIETVGPIDNFRMQYRLEAKNIQVPTPAGSVSQRIVQFKQFVLLPVFAEAGVSVENAMQPGSDFSQLIKSLRPDKTTISIWVYPESYADLRKLKNWLYAKNFQTAIWPLPQNAPISGGPDGFRSASQ